MNIKLLHHTPLWVASKAIRKCWASEDKSDTEVSLWSDGELRATCGEKDKELIHRVGNKNKHSSTLEHLNYSFDIDGISRACLQELARHRHASMSVKSTRYTLKELKEAEDVINNTGRINFDIVTKFCVLTTNSDVNITIAKTLNYLQRDVRSVNINDVAKYGLGEAYKTSLVWTINARSLQNFLSLRTSPSALWEIRELAYNLYETLPDEHKYLFEDYLYDNNGKTTKD